MSQYQRYKFTVTVEFFANKDNPLENFEKFFDDNWENSFMEIRGADCAEVSDPELMYDINDPQEIEAAHDFLDESD